MKGLEKSMTSSRTSVIVNGATAISALWKRGHEQNVLVLNMHRYNKHALLYTLTDVSKEFVHHIRLEGLVANLLQALRVLMVIFFDIFF